MKDRSQTIAIIGGGASGVLVAINILRKAKTPIEIKLIDKTNSFGRGLAYSTAFECHKLNVLASKMSAFPDDPSHFLRWLDSKKYNKEKTFIPRKIYGDYIQDVLNEAETNSGKLANIEKYADEVVDIDLTDEGSIIYFQNGNKIYADKVVLALGNFPSSNPPLREGNFADTSRYVSSAWSLKTLTLIEMTEPVLLIGSGLTMVDMALALREKGYKNIIHAISRHGFIPQSHQKTSSIPESSITEIPQNIRALTHSIRKTISDAASKGKSWHGVIDSIRSRTQQLWQNLASEEKKRFLRHVRSFWEVYRHKIAPEIGQEIYEMLSSGQLVIHSGYLLSYSEEENFINVKFRKRGSDDQQTLKVSKIINCTGPECDYRKINQPLVVNLLKKELICLDELRLGIKVLPGGAVINSKGLPSNLFYTLGPPQKGLLWETTAIPEISVQAQKLAEDLLEALIKINTH